MFLLLLFCFKIRFPWKEQWPNQRGQVFGGAEKDKLLCPKKLEVWGMPGCSRRLSSQDWTRGLSKAAKLPPRSLQGPGTKHPDRRLQLGSAWSPAWLLYSPGGTTRAQHRRDDPACHAPCTCAESQPPHRGPAPLCHPDLWSQLGRADLEP